MAASGYHDAARARAPRRGPGPPRPPRQTAARLPRHIKGMQPPQRRPQHPELRQRRPDHRTLDERSSQREPGSVQPDRIAGVGPDHPRRRVARRLQAVQGAARAISQSCMVMAGAPLAWPGTGASSRQARTTHGLGGRGGRIDQVGHDPAGGRPADPAERGRIDPARVILAEHPAHDRGVVHRAGFLTARLTRSHPAPAWASRLAASAPAAPGRDARCRSAAGSAAA